MKKAYPNPENCSQEELDRYIKLSKNVIEKNRLLAIEMLWQDIDVLKISQILKVSDVSIYNWIHRFNSKGLDGLLTRARGGRPRLVSLESIKELLNIFEVPQEVGQIHWTAKKFHSYLQEELKIKCDYSTVLRYLDDADYRLKYGRSWPKQPEGNDIKRDEFLSIFQDLKADSNNKIWFMDEAGFDGDPRPRRGWSKKGTRKKIYRTQKHLRMNVSGMVCPETGEFFALEFPYSNTDTFQAFLDVANREIENHGEKDIIILDNASWHKVKKINWGRFIPVFLPPYSPDLNPIERVWAYIKNQYFHSFTAKNLDQLIEQLDIALCSLLENKDAVASVSRVDF